MFTMLMKCNYLDKFHLCPNSQDGWGQAGLNPPSWDDVLTEAIYFCIPEDAKLRELFLRWCALSPEDQNLIDEHIITRERFDLYLPLKKALVHWDRVQDVQGAPGFENGLYAFTCDTRLDEELSNVVSRVEIIIDRTSENNNQLEKAFDLLDDESASEIKQLV